MTDYRDRLEAGEFDPPSEGERASSEQSADSSSLESLSKGELIERAQTLGVSPANASMSKGELIEAIEAAS